jgi:hypothetical protein
VLANEVPSVSIICLNTRVVLDRDPDWPGFPLECRSHHDWRPGTVTITWEPCGCSAAQRARGGHIKVACNAPGCRELWWRPRHQPISLPRILGHHQPGH